MSSSTGQQQQQQGKIEIKAAVGASALATVNSSEQQQEEERQQWGGQGEHRGWVQQTICCLLGQKRRHKSAGCQGLIQDPANPSRLRDSLSSIL